MAHATQHVYFEVYNIIIIIICIYRRTHARARPCVVLQHAEESDFWRASRCGGGHCPVGGESRSAWRSSGVGPNSCSRWAGNGLNVDCRRAACPPLAGQRQRHTAAASRLAAPRHRRHTHTGRFDTPPRDTLPTRVGPRKQRLHRGVTKKPVSTRKSRGNKITLQPSWPRCVHGTGAVTTFPMPQCNVLFAYVVVAAAAVAAT